jgi:branched-chain amino acid transport system substrate-binding protein
MRRYMLLFLLAACWLPACAVPTAGPPGRVAVQERGDALFVEAETYYQRGDFQQAWQRYNAYLQSSPGGRHALRARLREAEILGLLGDWHGALARYQAMLDLGLDHDANVQVRYNLARAYYRLDQQQQAAQILESLTATELPASLRFSTNALLTEIALKQRQIQNAFVRLRLASQDLHAGDQEWFEHLKTRLVEDATPSELEHLANLYRDSPLTAPLLLRLAQLAQKQGRGAEARKWVQILKERFPQSPEAKYAEEHLAPRRALLGCLLPLSGNYAELGRRVRQGMELAARDAPVELAFKDAPGDPQTAVNSTRALAQHPHLLAVLGPLASADAESAARTAQEMGIPLIALSHRAGLTRAGDRIFQISMMSRPQVQRLVGYTANLGMRSYASFAPNSPYGQTFARLFREELPVRGGVLVAQDIYPAETRDFTFALSPLLSKFQPGTEGSTTFEALFIPDDAPTVAALLRQLDEHPLRQVHILGTNLVRPIAGQDELAKALEGVLFTDAFFAGDPAAGVQNFVTAFRQRYGNEPDYLAVQGYMAVTLVAKALEAEPFLSRAELPRKLRSLSSLPELPWFRGFNPERQAELALYVLTIRDGQVRPAIAFPEGQTP